MRMRREAASIAVAAALVTWSLSALAAGSGYVRVTAARGPIRAEASAKSALVTSVPKGTRLEVVEKVGDWYRVLAPPDSHGTRLAGFIQASLVAEEPPDAAATTPSPGTKPGQAATKKPAAPPKKPSQYSFRGFGSLEFEYFQAHQSFDAIFSSSTGFLYGGGAEVSIGPQWFVQGRVSHMSKTGERAFVYNGEVSHLGIADTVSMTPFDVSVGYRVASKSPVTPYVAGGAGFLSYTETSASADSTDNTSGTFASYHVAGGVEVPIVRKWLSIAGEVQYRSVPGAIGKEGISKDLNESNLGGLSACVKILIGPQPRRPARPPKPAAPPPKPPAPKKSGIE